jgi:SAM-dependent MidA family methyltransferase
MNFPPQNISGLPEPDKASAEHSRELSVKIQQLIAEKGGAIPFSEFMNLALYAPAMGYYVAGQRRFGAQGDFVTAPELGDVFGRCLARQVAQILSTMNGECDVLEFGAGSGRLAVSLIKELEHLDVLPERYLILETSPDLQQRQQQTIRQQVPQHVERFVWLDSMPEQAINGVILANEVLDAMPVEIFAVDEEGNSQQYLVRAAEDGFQWDSRLAEGNLAEQITHLQLSSGYISELNPAVDGWIAMLAQGLEQGVVLLIDYGFPRHEYYHPQRSAGTLMCHYRHHSHGDPLTLVGIQDSTAHVDFTAVAEAAVAAELDVLGFTTQANFLLGSGLAELIPAGINNEEKLTKEQLSMNHEIQMLTSPAEMGELFKVIALGKNFDQQLAGFGFKDMRGKL